MKECLIVQYYVRDYKDEYILHSSLESYKKLGLDIILVSHSPISKEIQKKVKYFLYDGDDDLITFEDAYYNPKAIINTRKSFYIGDKSIFPFLFVVDDISYTFYKAVYDVYRLANALGYDNSYYIIGDSIINDNDIKSMIEIKNNVISQNKKGYFEIYKPLIHLTPFFWYVNNKWFLENAFPDMSSKNNFFESLNTICTYERIIADKILNHKNDVIIHDSEHIKISFIDEERFDLSKKDSKDFYDNDIGIFYDDNDKPNIVAFSLTNKTKSWRLIIEYNDDLYKHDISLNQNHIIKEIPQIESKSFRIKCEDTINKKTIYDIFIDDIDKYKKTFRIH